MNKEFLKQIRKTTAENIAKEICSVQPITSDFFKEAREASLSEEELNREGYQPIDQTTKLLWVKKDKLP